MQITPNFPYCHNTIHPFEESPIKVGSNGLNIYGILLEETPLYHRAQKISEYFSRLPLSEGNAQLKDLLFLKSDDQIHEEFVSLIPFIKDNTLVERISNQIIENRSIDVIVKIVRYYVQYGFDHSCYCKNYDDLRRNLNTWLFLFPIHDPISLQIFHALFCTSFFKDLFFYNLFFGLTSEVNHFKELLQRIFLHPQGIDYLADVIKHFVIQPETFSLSFFKALYEAIHDDPNKLRFLLILLPPEVVHAPGFKFIASRCQLNHLELMLSESTHLHTKNLQLNPTHASIQQFTQLFLDPPGSMLIPSESFRTKLKWMVYLYEKDEHFWNQITFLAREEIALLTSSMLKLPCATVLVDTLVKSLLSTINYVWGPKKFEAVLETLFTQNKGSLLSNFVTESLLYFNPASEHVAYNHLFPIFFVFVGLAQNEFVQEGMVSLIMKSLSNLSPNEFYLKSLIKFFLLHPSFFITEKGFLRKLNEHIQRENKLLKNIDIQLQLSEFIKES